MSQMGPVAGKILAELRKLSKRNVIDLGAVRRARRGDAEAHADPDPDGPALDPESMAGLPDGHRVWMTAVADLSAFAWPLLGARHLRKLAQRIEASDERYMPGGPPMSPLTDSFHTFWCLADTSIGAKRETLASIAVDIGRALGADSGLLRAWSAIASSYPGVYRVERRRDDIATLADLVTGERVDVELADDVPGQPGAVWWTRLLPPPTAQHRYWTSITTPYVFHARSAEREWRAFFDRQLDGDDRDGRVAAYRRLMKRGTEPFSWFEFILDAYVGVSGCAVALTGTPDRTESLPHHPDNERAPADDATPLDRVRTRLREIARAQRLGDAALGDFAGAREALGLPANLDDAVDCEMLLLDAYAMYGAIDRAGKTALDRLAAAADDDLPADEAAVVRGLAEGWFSVFEIVRVKIDEGFEVRDVLRRRRFWVHERSATRQAALGDLLAAWVMFQDGEAYFEGAVAHVPRMWAAGATESLRDAMGHLRKRRGTTWRRRQSLMAPLVSAIVGQLVREPPPLRLTNHDGDPLLMSEATYAIRGADAAATLARAPELEPDGDDALVWVDPAKDVLVARFEVDGATLRITTNSRQRLARARALAETRLGAAIEHKADSFSDPTSTALPPRDARPRDEPELPPEVREVLQQTLREQLARWIDTPIPALGNKTPRKAVRTARGRDDVAAMLLEQERMLRRGPGAEGIDFPAIWATLGLDYPEPTPGR